MPPSVIVMHPIGRAATVFLVLFVFAIIVLSKSDSHSSSLSTRDVPRFLARQDSGTPIIDSSISEASSQTYISATSTSSASSSSQVEQSSIPATSTKPTLPHPRPPLPSPSISSETVFTTTTVVASPSASPSASLPTPVSRQPSSAATIPNVIHSSSIETALANNLPSTHTSLAITTGQSQSSGAILRTTLVVVDKGKASFSTSTVHPTSTSTSTANALASKSFWENKSAVAGTFVVVGIVVLALLSALAFSLLKRFNQRRADRAAERLFEKFPEPEVSPEPDFRSHNDSPGLSFHRIPSDPFQISEVNYNNVQDRYQGAYNPYVIEDNFSGAGYSQQGASRTVSHSASSIPTNSAQRRDRGIQELSPFEQPTTTSGRYQPTYNSYNTVFPIPENGLPAAYSGPTAGPERVPHSPSVDSFYGV